MKTKIYNSRTLEITFETSKLNVRVQDISEVVKDAQEVKSYVAKNKKRRKKWFSKPSLSDVLLGAVISTMFGIGAQMFIGS